MDIVAIISGIIILYLGGEALIKGAVSVARHLKISKILVSSVIVGFGTSMPEMTVSVDAMLKNTPEIAVGNVIGSNIANILLILGISALITPFRMTNNSIKRDVCVKLSATIIFSLLGALQKIGFFHGLLLLGILVTYIIYSYIRALHYCWHFFMGLRFKIRHTCNISRHYSSTVDSTSHKKCV